MDYLEAARKVFAIEIEELRRVAARLDGAFVTACGLVKECVERRGKIVVLGVGKSGHIGEKISATLTSTGCPSVVLNSLNALHGDLGVVADGDVVLALSYGGETSELLNVLPALKRFDVRIIAITGNPRSSLGAAADVVLNVAIEREACPLGLAPTSSTTAMLVLGDALAMVVLEARGFRKEDFARYHPGGSLGRMLLTKVRDVMRPRDSIPLLSPETPVMDVIRATTRFRTGAAVLVHPDGRLAGIFTQGDFARHFPEHPDLARRPVREFMTPEPITIRDDVLAAEVLATLRAHRVDDLIVVNENHEPVGLVDSQDLSRLKLL